MFDWFKRLFGEGYIYFTYDYDNGDSAKGRVPYIGDINSFDEQDKQKLIYRMKKEVWFKTGKTVHNVRVIL